MNSDTLNSTLRNVYEPIKRTMQPHVITYSGNKTKTNSLIYSDLIAEDEFKNKDVIKQRLQLTKNTILKEFKILILKK